MRFLGESIRRNKFIFVNFHPRNSRDFVSRLLGSIGCAILSVRVTTNRNVEQILHFWKKNFNTQHNLGFANKKKIEEFNEETSKLSAIVSLPLNSIILKIETKKK